MNDLLRTTVYSLLTLLVASQAMAQELSIYPAKDQSSERQIRVLQLGQEGFRL
jgi:hypothetical protein